jgi:hypothetical protein
MYNFSQHITYSMDYVCYRSTHIYFFSTLSLFYGFTCITDSPSAVCLFSTHV